MSGEDSRFAAAAALRELNHAFVAHEPDEHLLATLTTRAEELTVRLRAAPHRDRLALMRASVDRDGFPATTHLSGFSDRAVVGPGNPTSIDMEARYEDGEVIAAVLLRDAFEGAPGRAHGGIVAAAFDEVTGYVIGMLREPAYTGELTVRFEHPVPVHVPLEMRARLVGRERRKLFITAEATHDGARVASCRATYITVDPAVFAGAPDPR
jgi:acyl-coenzyme A thioesterase PaaI-like protein